MSNEPLGIVRADALATHPSPVTSAQRTCRQCQRPIVGRSPAAKCCSKECQAAHKLAYLRAYMKAYRAREEYGERKRELTAKARQRSDYERRELERKRAPYIPKTRHRLPPMTNKEFRTYCKLRYACRMPRAEALAAILGAT